MAKAKAKAKAKKRTSTRPVPKALSGLFQRMSDDGPGTLSVLSVSASGLVRMRHAAGPVMGPERSVRDFSIEANSDLPGLGLVIVRAEGHQPVLVSAVPSAVMAVALR
jgi:hypothetical protein